MPTSVPQQTDPSTKASGLDHYLAGIGLLLMMGPLIGLLFAIYAIMPDYAGLQDAKFAGSDELGRRIGLSMTVSMWGFGAAVAGSALVAIAVVALGNRELWVYRYGISLAVVMCLTFGAFGVIFGVALILILAVRRSDFLLTKNQSKNKPTHSTAGNVLL